MIKPITAYYKKYRNLILSIFIIFFFNSHVFSQFLTDNTSGGVETIVIPPGVFCIRVQVWGGGAGGGGNNNATDGGGGGGGGGYSESLISVIPGATYNYSVGTGGPGGVGNASGIAGGQTYFNTVGTVMANGGSPGGPSSANGNNGGLLGAGGIAGIGNVFNTVGGAGGAGRDNNLGTGGGGGSSAGTVIGNAGTAGGATGGAGGIAPAGGFAGGVGGDQNVNGTNGSAPGGGGGGAGENNGAGARSGGSGGVGRIILTASSPICPTATTIAPAGIQNFCVGSATNTLTASTTIGAGPGCTATILYQWYSSLVNSNTIGTATLLVGQTASTLTPQNAIASTLYYFCVSYSVECAQTNATQALASNVVQVNILALPSASAAGPDQSICLASTATLAANIPVTGVGAWSVVAGPSLLSTQFNNTALNGAVFTPAGGVGAYTLRWTISNGTCSTSDDVIINIVTVTAAAAGPDLTPCSNNINLAGNTPVNGTGTWTCITNCAGIIFSNANSPTSTVSGLLNGVATTLRWTIANAPCASSSDNVIVTATVGANPQYTLVGSATSVSPFNCVVLTPAVNGQIGCAWDQNSTLAFASNFSFDFTINLGSSDAGADGIAFVMQNDPLGRCKCGLAGDQLGAGGITNSLIVEVDTYLNTDDRDDAIPTVLCAGGPDPDHMDLWLNGNVNPEIGNGCPSGVGERILPAAIPLLNGAANYDIENGLNHILRIAWNAGTTTLTATVLNSAGLITYGTFSYVFNPLIVFGTNTPYFGFTASTGGLNNTQSFCSPGVLLPVEMSAFNMECETDFVRFNWETVSEHNNDFFQMEISIDGINYLPSGIINGAGNSTTKQQYSWEDENKGNETTYYRLSQFDFDGTQKTLNTVASNCYDIKGIKILAMTNIDGNLVLNLENRLNDDYTIEIVDMTGKQVIQLNKKLESGINKVLIDKSEISSGIYFVRVNNSIESVVKKVGLF